MQEGVLSIVLPAYNPSQPIQKSVDAIQEFCAKSHIAHEIIVVDDGSDDAHKTQFVGLDKQDGVRLVTLENNSGKGMAVYVGFSWAEGSIIGFMDADLPYDLSVIHEALELIEPGATDVAIGSRRHPKSKQVISYGAVRSLANRVFGFLVGVVVKIPWRDTQCGAKFFTRSAAVDLFATISTPGFAFDVEILARAKHLGMAVLEIPVHLVRQQPSTVKMTTHGWEMWKDIWAIRKLFSGKHES